MNPRNVEVAIVGCGIAGIATAFYLVRNHGKSSVLLIDSRQPMSFTSAQSGDNYRNWWPHPVMVEFTNYSIDLMEELAVESDDVFNMRQSGYVLATRRDDIHDLRDDLMTGYGRIPEDVDIISGAGAVRARYTALSPDVSNVIHIRRGGDISGQQLGQYMLQRIRDAGGKRMTGAVIAIERGGDFGLQVHTADGHQSVKADVVVNAAGPFAGDVARLLGVDLPIHNVFQQKIAFEDSIGAVPRDMPFSIDLDEKTLGWNEEERDMIADDPELGWLAGTMPPGTHCRPEGGAGGKWVKLGWAYNKVRSSPLEDLAGEPQLDRQFPEIVIRGAAALIPSLRPYIDSPPTRVSHYGGYYTMTEENWPLIGPLGVDGAFMVSALSGFGSMSACAAGALCAASVCSDDLPGYASQLGLSRYNDAALMSALRSSSNKGLL